MYSPKFKEPVNSELRSVKKTIKTVTKIASCFEPTIGNMYLAYRFTKYVHHFFSAISKEYEKTHDLQKSFIVILDTEARSRFEEYIQNKTIREASELVVNSIWRLFIEKDEIRDGFQEHIGSSERISKEAAIDTISYFLEKIVG